MARIKPQALLQQSKKKKGPARIGIVTIVFCNVVLLLIMFLLVRSYRNWSRRSSRGSSEESSNFGVEDTGNFRGSKKYDLPSHAIFNTSKGLLTVELYKEAAPETVDKFIDLCEKGYFRGMLFHRVIKNYIIQGGSGSQDGREEDWPFLGEIHGQLATSPKHEAFMLGTSKVKRDDNAFVLYITTAPIPDLNDKLIVFGRVIKGEDIVQEIEEVDTDEHFRPKSPIGVIEISLDRGR